MKIPKHRYDYILILYFPILALGITLALLVGRYFLATTDIVLMLVLLLATLLAISPFGKQRIPIFNSSTHKIPWAVRLIALQLSLYLLFYMLTQTTPLNLLPQGYIGLYPPTWPLYLLLAIVFAFNAAQKKNAPLIDTCLRPLFGHWLDSIFGTAIDILIKQGLFFVCASTVSIALLQILTVLSHWLHWPLADHLQISNLLLTTLIFFLLALPLWQRYTRVLWYQGVSLRKFLALFIILLLSLLLLFNLATYLFVYFFPQIHPANSTLGIHANNFIANLLTWPTSWQLFSFVWWIGCAPLIAWLTAQCIQGQKIRVAIAVGFITPSGAALAWLWLAKYSLLLNASYWQLVLAIISLVLICVLFKDEYLTTLLISSGSGKNVHHRISLSSIRALFAVTASTLTLYLLTGLPLITLLFFSVTLTCFLAFLCVLLAHLLTLRFH